MFMMLLVSVVPREFSIVQKMIQEFVTELMVLSSLHTGTAMPMNWDCGTA